MHVCVCMGASMMNVVAGITTHKFGDNDYMSVAHTLRRLVIGTGGDFLVVDLF